MTDVRRFLDFGLAQVTARHADREPETTVAGTEPGHVLGTVGYMAPEQVRGQRADARADIFALGALLYEMLSGHRAFDAGSPGETLAAILRDDPSPLPATVPQAPVLDRIVRRCLEKSANERFQSARDVAFAIDAVLPLLTQAAEAPSGQRPARGITRRLWAAALVGVVLLAIALVAWKPWSIHDAANSGAIRIAVLPFDNLGTPDDEFFAGGLTAEIIGRLTTIDGIAVISRNSTLAYAGSQKTTATIGQELGVQYLLTGTVRWQRSNAAGGRISVAPTLIRVSDDTHVWAQSFDRALGGVIDVQNEIAAQVTSTLGRRLPFRSGIEQTTANVDAYQAYLRGLHHDSGPDRISDKNTSLVAQMFQRAVAIDPGFAVAHARLSIAYSTRYRLGYDRTDERLQAARREAEQARALSPGSAWSDVATGYFDYANGDYARAIEALEKAATRLGGEVQVFRGLGAVRRRSGQVRESLADYKRALEVDPRSEDLHREIASTYALIREYPQAIRSFDQSISLGPDQVGAYWEKARAQVLMSGSTAEAEATLAAMPRGGDPGTLMWETLQVPLLARRYADVITDLERSAPDVFANQERFLPKELALAGVYRLAGDVGRAGSAFARAAARLEHEREVRPSDGRVRAALGLAYAGLGRHGDAVREGREGVRLAGPETDAMTGPTRLYDLARVYAAVGDVDASLAALEGVLAIPSFYSAKWVALDPEFDLLRKLPAYAKLMQEHLSR